MKKQVLMCAPFNTRSGYGDHARSIFYSIMDREDFEIKCVDVRWGETPRNHLDPKIPKHKKLLDTFKDKKISTFTADGVKSYCVPSSINDKNCNTIFMIRIT